MEVWKKHPLYKRLEVSNKGRVRSVWPHKVLILKQQERPTTVGTYLYVMVTPEDGSKQQHKPVHKLVAETHVVPRDGLDMKTSVANHEDGNKHNNDASNLKWMTQRENLQHAIDTGLRVMVDEEGKALFIDKSKSVKVTNVSTGETKVYSSAKEASVAIGIPARTVQYSAFTRKKTGIVSGYIIEKN